MKVTAFLFACLATFMTFYFLLSGVGCLFIGKDEGYMDVISNMSWFMIYTLFFGWWITILCNLELYSKMEIGKILN